MVGRFDRTNTVVRMSEEEIKSDMLKSVRESEIKKFKNKLQNPYHNPDTIMVDLVKRDACSFEAACYLREYTWFRPLRGVTIPIPIEQWRNEHCKFPLMEEKGVIVSLSDAFVLHDQTFWKIHGPYKQYLGSGTKERVLRNYFSTMPATELYTETNLSTSLVQLLQISRSRRAITGLIEGHFVNYPQR